jgi:hypothetical protein
MAGFSKELDRTRACMQRRVAVMPKDSGDHQLDLLKFALNLATDCYGGFWRGSRFGREFQVIDFAVLVGSVCSVSW